MCFSAESSFAVGTALIPAAIYCIWTASMKKPRYLALAAVPLAFGVQQISEGFVWLALRDDSHAPLQLRAAALFFLFFALAFWPFWFPFLTMMMETHPARKAIFVVLALAATAWFWVLYYPLLVGPDALLSIRVEHHSIQYEYPKLAIYAFVDKPLLRVLYFLSVAVPPALASDPWRRVPGIVLGASALIAWAVFDYAFVSVWCFFAAVMAIYLCVIFYRLPNAESDA